MSTKIYNAYAYRGRRIRCPQDLLAVSERIRDALRPVVKAAFYRAAARKLAFFTDRVIANGRGFNAEQRSPLFVVTDEVLAAVKRTEDGVREPTWDTDISWTFHIMGEKIFLRLFAENHVVEAFEKAFPEFADHHYQNSTDRPSTVSSRSWAQRRRDWEHVLGRDTSATRGLSMSLYGLVDAPHIYRQEEVMRRLPSRDTRLDVLAHEIVLDAWTMERVGGRAKTIATSEIMGILREWADAKKTPAVIKRIAACRRQLQRKLPDRITKALIRIPCKTLATRRQK